MSSAKSKEKKTCYVADSKPKRDAGGRYIAGSSGNPAGRVLKLADKELSKGMRLFLEGTDGKDGRSKMQSLFEKLYSAAGRKETELRAIEIMLRYALVLPKTEIELSEPEERYKSQFIHEWVMFSIEIFKEKPEFAAAAEYFLKRIIEEYGDGKGDPEEMARHLAQRLF